MTAPRVAGRGTRRWLIVTSEVCELLGLLFAIAMLLTGANERATGLVVMAIYLRVNRRDMQREASDA